MIVTALGRPLRFNQPGVRGPPAHTPKQEIFWSTAPRSRHRTTICMLPTISVSLALKILLPLALCVRRLHGLVPTAGTRVFR